VLRRDDVPGFEGVNRRSGQLRGQDEFHRVLEHFRGIHGEAAIKGIKGDWGGGDNLDKFNKAIHSLPEIEIRADATRWNNALKSAALETYTGDWAKRAGFAEVEIVGYSSHERNNKITFDQVEVIFHKSGSGGGRIDGGPGQAPPPSVGPPGPASLGMQSAAGDIGATAAPEFARPGASHAGPGSPMRPPPARQTPRGPSPPGSPPPAGPGGGGGGRRGPGVRALTAREAAGIRPEVQLARTRRGDWAISWITSRDLYRVAWQDATGGQGGPAPPHGFLDRDRSQIVVFKPPTNVDVIARARPRQGPGPAEQPGLARRADVPGIGREPAPGRTPPAVRLPHDTDDPEVRGGWFDWLTRRRKLPKPQLGQQLSSGGDAGKLAFSKPGKFGVFEATLPDGQVVAVKIYPDQGGSGDANQRARFARDMAALAAASRTSSGPGFFGEVNVGPRRRGFAMERIEGDFAEAQPRTERELTDSERIAERLAQARITDRTLQDVERFGDELLSQGYYYDGEIQGLIDFKGRYRPIDFEKVRPLSGDPELRAAQLRNHQDRISNEIDDLQSLRRPPQNTLPADLPVPAHLQDQGQQVFGTGVIAWGHGLEGTRFRLQAIEANPGAERARLEANGLTLDMAKAWHVAYQHLNGQKPNPIFEARMELMASIVKLMTR
jgi:hypothetical protein